MLPCFISRSILRYNRTYSLLYSHQQIPNEVIRQNNNQLFTYPSNDLHREQALLPTEGDHCQNKTEGMHRRGPLVSARIHAGIWRCVCEVPCKDHTRLDPQGITFATHSLYHRQKKTCDCWYLNYTQDDSLTSVFQRLLRVPVYPLHAIRKWQRKFYSS